MSDAKQQVINQLESLAAKRFYLQLEMEDANRQFKTQETALRAAHSVRINDIQSRIAPIDNQIWQLISEYRSSLIMPGKQSFAIMNSVFKFRRNFGSMKILNEAGIMQVARKLKIVNKIADLPSFQWRFNVKSFLAWLNQHPEQRAKFNDFISTTGETESLTLQPNENYTVFHNSARISPPSITIKKS